MTWTWFIFATIPRPRKSTRKNSFIRARPAVPIVSSALELTRDIIAQRYPPTDWNIYAAQASDGDNWNDDSPVCEQLLAKQLLPQLRYYAYVEITKRDHQGLWDHYSRLLDSHDNFAMQQIREYQEDIYPVFREFFRKQTQ